MSKILKYILLITALICCISYTIFFLTKSNNAAKKIICKDIIIEVNADNNNYLITPKDIAKELKKNKIEAIGIPMKSINTSKIEKTIKRKILVEKAECYKSPNGIIHIDITQKTPLFRVVGEKDFYVSTNGEKLPISGNNALYLPLLTGNIDYDKAIPKDLFNFVKYISNNKFWNSQIEQIDVTNDNTIELVPRVGNHIIILGKPDRYQQKLNKLIKFYKNGLNKIGWNNYSLIDIRYKDQVICR